MPRDFAKPNTTRKPRKAPPKPRVSRVRLALALAILAGFVALLYLLKQTPPAPTVATDKPVSQPKPKTQPTPEPAPERKQFDFYEILPNSEIIPPTDHYTSADGDRKPKRFILQTGSFRRQEDAERQRATIGLQGLASEIERVGSDDNIWYRVVIGPFESRSKLNKAIDRLVAINIKPLKRQLPDQ